MNFGQIELHQLKTVVINERRGGDVLRAPGVYCALELTHTPSPLKETRNYEEIRN